MGDGSGSLANVASFTPGRGRHHPGDERARARHVLRRGETTTVDYSTAQQLITTAWNVLSRSSSSSGSSAGRAASRSSRVVRGREGEGRRAEEQRAAKRSEARRSAGRRSIVRRRPSESGRPLRRLSASPFLAAGAATLQAAPPARLVVARGALALVAADVLPGATSRVSGALSLVAAVVAVLNAILPPLIARCGSVHLASDSSRSWCSMQPCCRRGLADRRDRRLLLGRAARRARRRRSRRRPPGRARSERRRHVHPPGDPAPRRPVGRARRGRRAGNHLPRDRRPRAPVLRRAMRDGTPRTWPLAGRGHAPPRGMGDRPLVADRCEPGGHPAGVERGHLGVPLGGQGDRPADRCSAPADCAEIERGGRPGSDCSRTAARAAATFSRARPTT